MSQIYHFAEKKQTGSTFKIRRNQSFIPEGRRPEIFIAFLLQLANKDGGRYSWYHLSHDLRLSYSDTPPFLSQPTLKNPPKPQENKKHKGNTFHVNCMR